jgi:ribonuclease HI
MAKKAVLYTDGGARGNPGPAGIGFVLTIDDQEPFMYSAYLGEMTNNQAEYLALTQGLEEALTRGVTDLTCILDSELVVRQLEGRYRVKDQKLQPLFAKVKQISQKFKRIEFRHVSREKNEEADRLVNEAVDKALAKNVNLRRSPT